MRQAVPSVRRHPAAVDSATPQRRCIVTGGCHDRAVLLRFVVGPDGEIVPDIEARLPGRGLWLMPRRDIVERAVTKRVFSRAARRPVTVSADLPDRIEVLLARRCVELVGVARRAGLAVAGFDRVNETLRRGRMEVLLVALDGADGGRRKLAGPGHDLPVAGALTAAELGGAFGRERIVYAAVGGALGRRLLIELRRLAGMRADGAVNGIVDMMPVQPAVEDGGSGAHG